MSNYTNTFRLPLTASSGMLAQPSVQTNLAMQQESITRQPAPYVSNCTSEWPQGYNGPERQARTNKYTFLASKHLASVDVF